MPQLSRPDARFQDSFLAAMGDDYLGRISLRHELTERLLEVGGHIGYDVRRSRRRQGHATRMLAAVIPEAARLGVSRVLVTCDAELRLLRRRCASVRSGSTPVGR